MNLIVTGSRDWTDCKLLFATLDNLTSKLDRKRLMVHVGDARGVDSLVRQWCFERRIAMKVFHADWDTHRKAAGFIRNREMIEAAGPKAVCVAFHKNNSPGTADCIRQAKKAGLQIRIVRR